MNQSERRQYLIRYLLNERPEYKSAQIPADTKGQKGLLRALMNVRLQSSLQVLYPELGVGGNTPVIIKYPFWRMTAKNPKAAYICVNYGEAFCPKEIEEQSICIDADIHEVLKKI